MTRVLLIDRDLSLAPSLAMTCLQSGVAIRMTETLCEGVRCLLDEPVSVVLVDAALTRLPGTDLARLFDTVAPGVPVVVLAGPAFPVEESAFLELHGFHVVAKPFDIRDVLAKLEPLQRIPLPRAGAVRQVEAVCG